MTNPATTVLPRHPNVWRRVLHGLGAALLALAVAIPAGAQIRPAAQDLGASGLGLKLRKAASGVSVLTITAHPDDENSALHALLSRGLGARVSLLTLTRGGGGQNEIGPELFDGLRLLRSEELAASHRLDAVEQYYGMVSDFGYSFSAEETLEKWGEDETLGEVVRMIRELRPDVILTLAPDGPGGGQHHQATGRITHLAYDAAGDPDRFPEHFELGLRPWTPERLFVDGVGGGGARSGDGVLEIVTTVWDPLLGRTWADLGQEARSAHRCQGMGQVRPPGSLAGPATLVLTRGEPLSPPGDAAAGGLFGSLPTGLSRIAAFLEGSETAVSEASARLDRLAAAVAEAQAAFSATAPREALPGLRRALDDARSLRGEALPEGLTEGSRYEVEHRMAAREEQIAEAIALAHGLVAEAVSSAGHVVPGGRFSTTVSVLGGPVAPVTVTGVRLEAPDGWTVTEGSASAAAPRPGPPRRPPPPALGADDLPAEMGPGTALRVEFGVAAAPDAALSRQPWRDVPGMDRFVPASPELFGAPARPAPVEALVAFRSGEGAETVEASVRLPVEYRYEGPWVGTEKQKTVSVLPAASVAVSPEIVVFPRGRETRRLSVSVVHRGDGPRAYRTILHAPDGWTVTPPEARAAFDGPGELRVEFEVSAPPGGAEGRFPLAAEARPEDGGPAYDETVQEIAYHHIETRYLFRPAAAQARVLDAVVAPVRVGYVEGVGDEVAEAIAQLGIPLAFLDETDLAEGDLSRFDTIVLGVRAYLARPDLRTHNQRLLDFVEGGGTLLVQYNKFEFNAGPWGPYPVSVGRGRITVEDAPMTVLIPDHPVFRTPNRIGDADWDGWVQERGLYFLAPSEDPRYRDLLASEDPFEYNAGEKRGILVEARHGEGRWLYLGLGLWRQLPAGTPGAYRLLANLLSLGRPDSPTDQN